jgi:hypothetical protein
MQFTHEHREIQKTLKRLIDEDINPNVDEWEEAGIFRPMRYSKNWATWAYWA